VPADLSPDHTRMFKTTRGIIRMFIYYMKPTPAEGDMPSLISKAMFGGDVHLILQGLGFRV